MKEVTLQATEGLGSADASQVLEGATFTSETGINQEGNFSPSAQNITYDNEESGMSSTNVQGAIDEIVGALFEKIYPVGSVYISTVYANPKDLFNFGEWEQIKDKFLLSGGDTYLAGTTGGSAYINLWHKHLSSFGFDGNYYYTTNIWGSRYVAVNPSTGGEAWGISGVPNSQTSATQMSNTSEALDANGNVIGEKSILPPYLTVYMWKRTA